MTSEKKIRSNRRNSLKSTGPRTAAGKSIVSGNAVKHGLCARHIIINGESSIEFEDFKDSLTEQFQPVGMLELLLVNRIIAALWRLRRLGRIEVELFDHLCRPDAVGQDSGSHLPGIAKADIAHDHNFLSPDGNLDRQALTKHLQSLKTSLQSSVEDISYIEPTSENLFVLSRYLRSLLDCDLPSEDADALNMALQQISEMSDSSCRFAGYSPGQALANDYRTHCVTVRFSRYESHIERSLFRSLHELQRLQAKRQGRDIAAPVAVDIGVA